MKLLFGKGKPQVTNLDAGLRLVIMHKLHHGGEWFVCRKKEGDQMNIRKISDKEICLDIKGQGCGNDCLESKVWVGATNGNTKGCVIYENAYTPKTTSWW